MNLVLMVDVGAFYAGWWMGGVWDGWKAGGGWVEEICQWNEKMKI